MIRKNPVAKRRQVNAVGCECVCGALLQLPGEYLLKRKKKSAGFLCASVGFHGKFFAERKQLTVLFWFRKKERLHHKNVPCSASLNPGQDVAKDSAVLSGIISAGPVKSSEQIIDADQNTYCIRFLVQAVYCQVSIYLVSSKTIFSAVNQMRMLSQAVSKKPYIAVTKSLFIIKAAGIRNAVPKKDHPF